MIVTIQFEGAFLRAALLVGLVHEREVPAWATEQIGAASDAGSQLAELLLVPVELSPMREALRPLGDDADGLGVAAALLIAVAIESATRQRSAIDRLRVLAHIRREFPLPQEISAGIKDFEDRAMLAAADVRGAYPPSTEELTSWLDHVRTDGYFWFRFEKPGEAEAFLAALSRKMVRHRTWTDRAQRSRPCAWVQREGPGGRYAVILNEGAWQIVVREFSPVPLSGRIPHGTMPADVVAILDELTVTPLGADEAHARMAG